MENATTLFDTIWDGHEIQEFDDGSALIYTDRVFLHECAGAITLKIHASDDRTLRNPQPVFCTTDHIVDTYSERGSKTVMPGGMEHKKTTHTAAKETPVTTIHSSLGDLGGCPWALGDDGNIVTEDLVFMLETMGLKTGVISKNFWKSGIYWR